MVTFTIWSLRLFGISGIIGSLLFIWGDQLYIHIPVSIDSAIIRKTKLPEGQLYNGNIFGRISSWFYTPENLHLFTENMSKMPESRLLNAGMLGLIGSWFYTLASLQLYIAFRPAGNLFASITFLTIAAAMICYGIVHTAYFSIAAGAHAAVDLGSDAESGGKLGNIFFLRILTITSFPAIISTVMMVYGILTGQSMYPRWMAIFVPMVMYIFKIPLRRIFKGRLQEFFNESYENLVLFVFFVLSTVILWNGLIS
jgi:hypothetical protein